MADNTVIVSESFDEGTATQLRELVRRGAPALHALAVPDQELSLNFYQLPHSESSRSAWASGFCKLSGFGAGRPVTLAVHMVSTTRNSALPLIMRA